MKSSIYVSMLFSAFYLPVIAKKGLPALSKSITSHQKSAIFPKTAKQKKYWDLLKDSDTKILFALGPAGCGKTLLACNEAIHQLKCGKVKKIILSRPTVSVENENLGFLPGSIHQKMDPWTRPFFDILHMHYTKKQITSMMEETVIEVSPIGFMRGRTFHDSFIIADEMQNSSPNQMKMLLTRIGSKSKMVVTGDLNQSDLSGPNGLHDIESRLKTKGLRGKSMKMIHLKTGDVVRDEVVKVVLKLYGDEASQVKPLSSIASHQSVMPRIAMTYKQSESETEPLINQAKRSTVAFDNDCALIPLSLIRKGR